MVVLFLPFAVGKSNTKKKDEDDKKLISGSFNEQCVREGEGVCVCDD